MTINKETKDELEILIITKMAMALGAITKVSNSEADQQAAAAVNSLSNALLNIDACTTTETGWRDDEEEGRSA